MCSKYSFIIVICSIFLVACGHSQVTILDNLDQKSVNNVLNQLLEDNIKAEKTKNKDGTFSVSISNSDERRALLILNSNGMPRPSFATLGVVFKKDSFISSPLEEQARLIYALEEQISQMISQIDGVVDVSTQITLPPPSESFLQNDNIKPSAAVVIVTRSGSHLEIYSNRIKQLVANSVPGLDFTRVEILFVTQKI